MATDKECPCLICVSVQNPKQCENKNCTAWRAWWIARWKNLRKRYIKK